MSTAKPSRAEELFKTSVIVLLTLLGLFVAVVTFLEGHADQQAQSLVQQSELTALDATGLSFRAGLEVARGVEVRQLFADYLQRAVRADTKARALRLGGQFQAAAEFALDAKRWQAAAEQVRQSDLLLSQYGQDEAVYQEALARPAYVESERQFALLAQSRAWADRDNGYIAILSTLAVALFLTGLSLTVGARVRYLLAAAGLGLAAVCGLWVLAVLLAPVPDIPAQAIEHFADGQVEYNLANARGQDAVEAVADFDLALSLAPDYARAYFYRSLANTDSRLAEIHLNTGQAVADAERALELGLETSPVYGNLGWLYFLNGQYRSALAATETALGLSPDECYLTLNHGLILTALQQPEAGPAYETAIACADRQSADLRNYYLDVGVVDLEDLALARPDLQPAIEPAARRLKEALASLRLLGAPVPAPTSAQLGPLAFGDELDGGGQVIEDWPDFPQTTQTVYAGFDFSGLARETRWLERWLLDGQEHFALEHAQWTEGDSGRTWVGITNAGGLSSGRYRVDIFVEGNLLMSGGFTIQPGPMPPMTSYQASDVGASVNYPQGWQVTELADNEVSVVAARAPEKATFFGVTAWTASTGSDDDVFQLFDLNHEGMRQDYADYAFEAREPFLVAGRDGWLSYYTYTDRAGLPIQGALAGVLDSGKGYVYMLVIESAAAEWDADVDLFNLMLSRISID